jgi:hypothetical protein
MRIERGTMGTIRILVAFYLALGEKGMEPPP